MIARDVIRVDPELRGRVACHRLIRTIVEYRDDVAEYDTETYYEVYEELLEPLLSNTTGRKHYRTVLDYLEEISS